MFYVTEGSRVTERRRVTECLRERRLTGRIFCALRTLMNDFSWIKFFLAVHLSHGIFSPAEACSSPLFSFFTSLSLPSPGCAERVQDLTQINLFVDPDSSTPPLILFLPRGSLPFSLARSRFSTDLADSVSDGWRFIIYSTWWTRYRASPSALFFRSF